MVEVLQVLGRIVGGPGQRGASAATAAVAIATSVTIHDDLLPTDLPSDESLPKRPPPEWEWCPLGTLRWAAPSEVDGLRGPIPA